MSGSAYKALPEPTVVNPLAAVKSGIEAASSEYNLREKQAQQAVGNILQQATDANGNVDYPKAQALAAQAGPVVQMGMQTMLKDTSLLQGQQTNNAAARMKFVAQSAITIARNPSDENVNASFDALAAHGVPADQVARERARWMKMSFDERQDEATRHGMFAIDQLNRTVGTTTIQTYGGTSAPTTILDPTGRQPGSAVVGPGIAHSVSAGDMVEVKDWVDANGNVVQAGTAGASQRTRLVHKSQAPGVPQGPPVVPATGGGTGTGGGGSTTTGAPPVPPPAGVRLIPPDYQPRPGTTTPATSTAPVTPPAAAPASPFGTGAFGGGSSTAPPAPTPSAPAALAPAAPPATTPPPGMVTSTTIPATTAAEQEASQKLLIADRTAQQPRQIQEQNLMHAYDALELVTSGKGTETASKWRNFLATVGALPPGQVNDEAIYEVGRKYLEKTISDIGNAGGSDIARTLAAASNPSMALVNPANLAVLRNDIGIIRQKMAAYMTAPDKDTGAGYGAHQADHPTKTDPRGFAWDKYSEPEKAEILKSVGAEGTPAHDALLRAIAMQKAFWPKKGAGPIVPHAEATPTAAPTNALAMAPQQSGNPLLAA